MTGEHPLAAPGPATSMRPKVVMRALLVGVVAGFLSGLFGVGGGILVVPGLVLLTGMSQRLAHGTSLAAIVPIACAGVGGYVFGDSIDLPLAAFLALGTPLGVVLGSWALRVSSPRSLRVGFAFLLLVTALRMVTAASESSAGRDPLTIGLAIALVATGLAAGALSGVMGVGGGVIIVPTLVVLFGIADPVAKGTSLLVIVPTALIGTSRNVRHDNADLPVALVVGLSGVVTAFLGARLSVGLSAEASALTFAALLTVVAIRMFVSEWRSAGGTT